MRAVIVAKTHMNRMACVGALELGTNKGIRLLQSNCSNQPGDTEFDVGQIWDLDYRPRPDVRPPHVEDVLVYKKQQVGEEPHLRAFLLERVQPWRGAPKQTFEGLVRPTYEGSGYINEIMGVPSMSTGFWIPDQPLTLTTGSENRLYYEYHGTFNRKPAKTHEVRFLRYVGYAPPANYVPGGTLVRLSLARWWRQEGSELEERCYLQMSGFYIQ